MARFSILIACVLSVVACKSDKQDGSGGKSSSGLAWEPIGYDKMSEGCRKTLACCEELVKVEKPSATADDYNLRCSGPALWKEADCVADLKSRVMVLESDKKPVPAACK